MKAVSSALLRRSLFEITDSMLCPLQDAWQRQTRASASEIINQKEVRFVGMRRTGNHALINWLMHQLSGEVRHLNNVVISRNPYRYKANNLRRYFPEHAEMAKTYQRQADGALVKRDCLLYSYEDWSLGQISRSRVEYNRELYFGKAARYYDVLILRDPFNLFASRLKKGFVATKDSQLDMVEMWLEYAKEFVGESHHLNRNLVCINYNRWFAQEDYRRQISKQMAIPFSDAGLTSVSAVGDGSSFDGTRFSGDARVMDVTNRWRHFENDLAYRRLFENDDIWKYSERIFGKMPGTESLQV